MFLNSRIDFKLIFIKNYFHIIFFTLVLSSNTSCTNQFSSFANKTTDEALLASAQENIRDADYSGAITDCAYMSGSFSLKEDVAMVCASAYAGRCGYSFIGTAEDLATFVPGPPHMLEWFESIITSSSAQDIADCATAESLIRTQGAAAARTEDENAFLIILGFRTIGLIADELDDADNNGVSDTGLACGAISDVDAQAFGSALWEIHKSSEVLQASSVYGPLFTIVDGLCSALEALDPLRNFCTAASPVGLNANQLNGARSLIIEGGAFGVDGCGGNTALPGCNCP